MLLKSKNPSFVIQQNSIPLTTRSHIKEGASRINKKKDINLQEADILIKACCPNCRYIFQVVNQNKLSGVKRKIQILDPILEQKSSFSHLNDNILSIPLLSPSRQDNQILEKVNNFKQIGKLLKQSKKNQEKSVITQKQLKIKVNSPKATLADNSIKDTHFGMKESKQFQPKLKSSSASKLDSQINNLKKLLSQQSENTIGKSKQTKSKKGKSNSEFILILNNLKASQSENILLQDYSPGLNKKAPDLQLMFASVSSIQQNQKKVIELCRDWKNNDPKEIQIFIALQAAKSQQLEQELQLLSKHTDSSPYLPSYVKGLAQEYIKQ